MPTYKLTYFDVKALGEGIRMILSYMGADWEDERVPSPLSPESPWHKEKSGVKFSKLPILEIDGKKVYQSTAICRYLAGEAGLLGSNAWENLQIDIIAGSLKDLVVEVQRAVREKTEEAKEEKMKTLKEEILPKYAKEFDDIAMENNGYLANGKLSWVDLFSIGVFETVDSFSKAGFLERPHLKALQEKVCAIPNVKKWIEKRPQSI